MAYITKTIEQAHIVWFEASNQWVQMDEQQWLIFCFYRKDVDSEKAAKSFAKRFNVETKKASRIIVNAYNSLNNLTNPTFKLPQFFEHRNEVKNHILKRVKNHNYIFNKKHFSLTFGSPFLEQYIHLPLGHLEVKHSMENELSWELFTLDNRYILRNNINKKCFSAEEPGQIKRLLYIELTNFFFGKTENSWMSLIHGSAVTKDGKLLILTSAGGSGKSTMAGLLMQNGFGFFSDDYIPVDAKTKKAFPFPASLCIKNNAIELLESKGLNLNPNKKGNLAYAVPANKMTAKPVRISRIVFIQYIKGKKMELKPIPALEALLWFMQEAWVGNDLPRARKFINWFAGLNFYKLEYGNNDMAIDALKDLIEKS